MTGGGSVGGPRSWRPFRVAVLASGFGSNLQALIDATAPGGAPAGAGGAAGPTVVAVFSDRPEAYALERARKAGIPAIAFPPRAGLSPGNVGSGAGDAEPPSLARERRVEARRAYDAALADEVSRCDPDLVFLLGWMRVLSSAFLSRFPGMVVNLHPALPGTFPGTRAIGRAFEAFKAGEIGGTGAMVHYVPDEGVDSGPVIASEAVPILPGDALESLEARVHEAERRLVVGTLRTLYIRGTGGPGQGPDVGSP